MFLPCDAVGVCVCVYVLLFCQVVHSSLLSLSYKYHCRAMHRFIFHRFKHIFFLHFCLAFTLALVVFYRFLFTQHSNFQFTFVLFWIWILFSFFLLSFNVINVVHVHFLHICNNSGNGNGKGNMYFDRYLCVSSAVACGIQKQRLQCKRRMKQKKNENENKMRKTRGNSSTSVMYTYT